MSQPVRLRCHYQSDVTTCQTEKSLPTRCHNLSEWDVTTNQMSQPVRVWFNCQVSQPVTQTCHHQADEKSRPTRCNNLSGWDVMPLPIRFYNLSDFDSPASVTTGMSLPTRCHNLSVWDVTTSYVSQPVSLRCHYQLGVTTCQSEMSLPTDVTTSQTLIPLLDVTACQTEILLPVVGCHNLSDFVFTARYHKCQTEMSLPTKCHNLSDRDVGTTHKEWF